MYPFGNNEAYISISPKDFIIFPEKYQNLVNNSFLLHGYYNYQHIILGRKEEGSKGVYYLDLKALSVGIKEPVTADSDIICGVWNYKAAENQIPLPSKSGIKLSMATSPS